MTFSKKQVSDIAKKLKYTGNLTQLSKGMAVEEEHRNVTRGSIATTAKIAIAHLSESQLYYRELAKMEKKLKI